MHAPADPIAHLCGVFSAVFPAFAKNLPLKIGVHRDIKAAMPELSMTWIRRALGAHTRDPGYRQGLVPGRERFDLEGKPAGLVTEREALGALATTDSTTEFARSQLSGAL
jgi:ProP effector